MRNFLKLGSAQYFVVASQLVTGPIIARALGPTERGVLAALLIYYLIVPVVFGYGFPARLRLAAANRVSASVMNDQLHAHLRTVLPAVILVICTILLVFHNDWRVGISIALLTIASPFTMYRNGLLSAAVAFGQTNQIARNSFAQAIINLSVTILLYFSGSLTVLTISIQYLLLSIFTYYLVKRDLWPTSYVNSNFPSRSYGLSSLPAQIVEVGFGRIEHLVLIGLLGAASGGIYAVSISFASLLLPVLHTRSVLLSSPDKKIKQTRLVNVFSLVASVTALLFLLIFAPLIIGVLFGTDYTPSVLPAQILLFGYFNYGFALQFIQKNLSSGRVSVNSRSYLLAIFVSLAVALLAYKSLEEVAFAIGFAISTGVLLLVAVKGARSG